MKRQNGEEEWRRRRKKKKNKEEERQITKEYGKLDKEIISLIEKTGESFSFHRRSYNGIKFNDRQYNKYVKNINSLYENDDGKLMSPNDPGYREDFNLLSRLNKMIVSKEYINLATNEEKMDMMKAELRHARELAIKQTIDTDVNLKFLTRPNDWFSV